MEILKDCQALHEELQNLHKELRYVTVKLERNDSSPEELLKLYEDEFRIAMNIMGCFEDLLMRLDELEKTAGMLFIANRIRNNAQLMVVSGGIDVTGDV